jgi:branched-chain amino acid transport system ATP-binding protein
MAEGFGDFTVWDYLQLSRGCARDPDGAGAIGAAGYARRCEEWLDWVGAGVRADALMHNLSYGVRKLVDLCRVVATEPVVTLLDEPTSGLAAADRERMRDRIAALRDAGRTLVIVDHDVSFVTDVSTRVAAFVQGRKIADGRPGDVLRDPNVSMSYLGS